MIFTTRQSPHAPNLKAATARILVDESDRTAGTGLLLLGGFVVTCAHVVRRAVGLLVDELPSGGSIHLQFPHAGAGRDKPLIARVADRGWRPDVDVAVLKIESEAPYQAGWNISKTPTNEEQLDVDCFGFGVSFGSSGNTAEARIPSNAIIFPEASLFRRNVDSGLEVEKGCSGAPVYDPRSMRVLGLLRGYQTEQKKQVGRLILGEVVYEVFLSAWDAGVDDDPSTKLAALFAAAREAVANLKCNMPRLPQALNIHIDGLEETISRPETCAEASEELTGIHERWEEAKWAGLVDDMPRFVFGPIIPMLERLVGTLRRTSVDSTHLVSNDWDVNEKLSHAKEIPGLLDKIKGRLTLLAKPGPPLSEGDRHEACAALRRLRRIISGHPLSLLEMDEVRTELERLDRDVFATLIRECQLLLGLHAAHLPDFAVFRDRLQNGAGPELVIFPAGSQINQRFCLGRYPTDGDDLDEFRVCKGTQRTRTPSTRYAE